jgi:hypothetical protein
MGSTRDERTMLRIFRIRRGEEEYAAFVIDGRKYEDSESVLAAVREAWDELERRRIPGDVETSRLSPTEPPLDLPSWDDYRQQLLEGQATER